MGVGRRRHLELRSAVRSTAGGHRRGEMVTASKRCSQNTVHPSAAPLGRANWHFHRARRRGDVKEWTSTSKGSCTRAGTRSGHPVNVPCRMRGWGMKACMHSRMGWLLYGRQTEEARQGEAYKCELTRALDCSRMQPAYEVSYSGPPVQERTTVHCIMGGLVLRRTKPQTMTKRPFARKRGAFVSV